MTEPDPMRARAGALHLHGLLAHWPEVAAEAWVAPLLGWEEQERARRSLERRLGTAHIGRFKPLCDFDWAWPKRCDRAAVEALMTLDFLAEAANVVLVGPNGVGKSTLAQNIAHQALIHGHTVLFTSAGQLLGDLCALDSDSALRRRLRHYAWPQLLMIDEVGYTRFLAAANSGRCAAFLAGPGPRRRRATTGGRCRPTARPPRRGRCAAGRRRSGGSG